MKIDMKFLRPAGQWLASQRVPDSLHERLKFWGAVHLLIWAGIARYTDADAASTLHRALDGYAAGEYDASDLWREVGQLVRARPAAELIECAGTHALIQYEGSYGYALLAWAKSCCGPGAIGLGVIEFLPTRSCPAGDWAAIRGLWSGIEDIAMRLGG